MNSREFASRCQGSGGAALQSVIDIKADTLITGDLRQHHFNLAQEYGINLYACGHYATEVFGVQALAREIAQKFNIPWEFISTGCIL